MNILVTGGTGFIGTALVAKLTAAGHEVLVWSRNPVHAAQILPGARVVDALFRVDEVAVDAVVNLAGAPIAAARWSDKRKAELRKSRVDLTRHLVGWLEDSGQKPKVLVSASAVGYYGDQGDNEVVISTPPASDFAHELCRDWEAAAHDDSLGCRVCIMRFGVVLGRGGALAKLLPVYKMGLGGLIGNGRQWLPWVHRDDAAAMIVHALGDESCNGAYNIVAPGVVRQKDFSRELARLLGRPRLTWAPAWVLRAALGEMAVLLVGGQRIVDGGMPGYEFAHEKLAAALRNAVG